MNQGNSGCGYSPKVSVIMPAYNCADLVGETIASIRNQTLKEIEIIIINDGSTDNTLEVLEQWARDDSRIILETIENKGPANGRNFGIGKASGEYIYFIDSDDLIHCKMLEEMYSLAQKNNLDVCACGYVMQNISIDPPHCKEFLFHDFIAENADDYRAELMPMIKAHLMYVVWNKLFKTSMIKDNNITFPSFYSGEDRLFNTASFCSINRFGFINKPFYRYFLRGQKTLANKYLENRFDAALKCHEDLIAAYKKMKLYNSKNEAYIGFMFIKGVMSCVSQLNAGECKLSFKQKLEVINNMLKNPLVQEAIRLKDDEFSYSKIINGVLRLENKTLIYLMGKAIYLMQFKLNTIYLNIKHKTK